MCDNRVIGVLAATGINERSLAVEKLKMEVERVPENAVIGYYFESGSSSLLRQLCERDVPLPTLLTTKWEEWDRKQYSSA